VDSLDDLVGVDALAVDRRDAQVAVTKLALDDVERHALAQQLQYVRVTQLVRREAPTHARLRSAPAQGSARRRGVARRVLACGR
jgi:hypothetical protein